MKSYFFFIFLFLCICKTCYCQDYDWAYNIGSSGSESIMGIETDGVGNVYVTGILAGTADMNPGIGTSNLPGGTFLQKVDASSNLIWAKSLGGIEVENFIVDSLGNIYSIGTFSGTRDFDPGTGVFNLTALASYNTYIQKLDSNGDFVWAIALTSSQYVRHSNIHIDNNLNIVAIGEFGGTADFDPGPAMYNLTSSTLSSNYMLKVDNNGNFLWAHQLSNLDWFDVTHDSIGDLYIIGTFGGTIDFDPTPLVDNHTVIGSVPNTFITKYDANGNYQWVHCIEAGLFGVYGTDKHPSITTDKDNNILALIAFKGVINANPVGLVPNLLYSKGGTDLAIIKYDNNFNFLWARSYGSEIDELFGEIKTDSAGYIYTAGSFYRTVDFDPSYNTANLTYTPNHISGPSADGYQLKLDPSGNFVWVKQISGSMLYKNRDIAIGHDASVYATGLYYLRTFWTIQGTYMQLNAVGQADLTVSKLYQDSCSNLTLSIDSLANVQCNSLGQVIVNASNGLGPYSYTWSTSNPMLGNILNTDSAGIYSVTVTDNKGCQRSTSVSISAPPDIPAPFFDLNSNMHATAFRSNLSSSIWIDAFNNTCTPISGQLKVVIDTLVSYDSASIAPDIISRDTLIWNFSNLTYEDSHLVPRVHLTTSSTAQIGDSVCFQLIMQPTNGDIDSSNNIKVYCYPVVNSYDPNLKEVYPQGLCSYNYILSNQKLTYTIHFQNTGNAPAFDVNIIDTLSSFLDINSLQIVGQSHPNMITEVIANNVVRFGFENINLPDSVNNEPESHGYIIFEISPNASVPNGTFIANNASIYFDFNPPIKTNTVSNTLINFLPSLSSVLIDTACGNYSYNNQTYTSSGSYINTFQNTLGCDSLVTLNLTVYPNSFSASTEIKCDSFIAPSGAVYYNTGLVNDTISNFYGCDSVITITIYDGSSTGSISTNLCPNGMYQSPSGKIYTTDGTYQDTIVNSLGCDSVITITIYDGSSTGSISTNLCPNGMYQSPSGKIYTTDGTYQDTIANSLGCDSVITITIYDGSSIGSISANLCPNGTYQSPSGKIYTIDGTYLDTIANSLGCDSVITINLSPVLNIDTSVLVVGNSFSAILNSNYSYQWINCSNDMPIQGAINHTFNPVSNGSYAVIITSEGCSDTSSCYAITTIVSTMNLNSNENDICVIPNPTRGQVTIVLDQPYSSIYTEIFNNLGQLKEKQEKQYLKQFSLIMPEEKGLYFIRLHLDHNSTKILKVFKN